MGFFVLSAAKEMLGDSGLGVWALAMSFATMAALIDFGFGPALGILVAKYSGKGDSNFINQSVNAFVFISLPLALAITIIGLMIAPFLAASFVVDASWKMDASVLFSLMFVTISLRLIGSVLGGLLIGYQFMGVFKIWMAIWALIRTLGILWLLYDGQNLQIVGAWVVLTTVGGLLSATLLLHRSIALRIELRQPSKVSMQELWQTALPLQTARMAGAILGQADKFILAGMIGVMYAGWYELAAKLAGSVLLLPGFMLAAMAPLVSAMVGKGEHLRVKRLLHFTTRYLNIIAFCMTGFLFLYADIILVWWLGDVAAEVILATRVMLVLFLIMAVQQPYIDNLLGLGDKRTVMRFSLIVLFANIPLSLFLVDRIGFSGSYWSTLIVVIAASFFFFMKAFVRLELTWRDWLGQWKTPLLASVGTTLVLYPFALIPNTLMACLMALTFWVMIYVFILWLLRGFGKEDVMLFINAWKAR